MSYHLKEIKKGVLGEFSKIEEEFNECKDAIEQGNSIMELVELSDMIGAIELYVINKHSKTLEDLIIMKNATQRAFKNGSRK